MKLECEGQKYFIKGFRRNRQGMGRTVQVTCQHIMRRMMDTRIPYASAQPEALGKDITYFTNLLSTATDGVFTFQIMDTFPLKDVYKWGYSNCLKGFQDVINAYQAEFIPDNAYFDGEFEEPNISADTEAGKVLLLGEIRKRLAAAEIQEIQVQVNAADLWKNNAQEVRPQLGETTYLIDPDMQLSNMTARVMELTEYPFDKSKNTQATLANYLLKDDNDILAELNASKKDFENLLTNKKVNTSLFETFAKQAVIDINNSKTQVKYDSRGIVLQDLVTANNQVIMSANGIYLTTNGGTSSVVAITAAGVIAGRVIGILGEFAQVKTDNLIAGVGKISTALIDTLIVGTNVQIGSAQDAAGVTTIVGNTVTTGYVNALNVTANTVNAGWVYAGGINAGQITAGTLTAFTIQNQTSSANKIYIDSTGLHANDSSSVKRIEIATTPARGAKALMLYGAGGVGTGLVTYDTETIDGLSRTGLYIIGTNAQALLFQDDGSFRLLNNLGYGIRGDGSSIQINKGSGWVGIADVNAVARFG